MHTEQKTHEEIVFTFSDFINVLAKRWKLFAGIVVFFLIWGLVYFKTRPLLPFTYRTTIEIGAKVDGTLIEPFESVKAKFEEAYIPEVLATHAEEKGYKDQRYFVKVEDTKEKSKETEARPSITLVSQGGESIGPAILEIHTRIADRFIDDHVRRVEIEKQTLGQKKLQAELELDTLEDDERRIPRKQEFVDATAAILRNQIESTEKIISVMEQDRSHAIASASMKASVDQSLATTFLLVDSVIAKYQDELRSLEERLFITLAKERSDIDREEAELKRKQREQKQLVADLKLQIDSFSVSRILLSPSRLPRPPLSGALYQTLSIFGGVGFFLGLLTSVFVEYAADAAKRGRSR